MVFVIDDLLLIQGIAYPIKCFAGLGGIDPSSHGSRLRYRLTELESHQGIFPTSERATEIDRINQDIANDDAFREEYAICAILPTPLDILLASYKIGKWVYKQSRQPEKVPPTQTTI